MSFVKNWYSRLAAVVPFKIFLKNPRSDRNFGDFQIPISDFLDSLPETYTDAIPEGFNNLGNERNTILSPTDISTEIEGSPGVEQLVQEGVPQEGSSSTGVTVPKINSQKSEINEEKSLYLKRKDIAKNKLPYTVFSKNQQIVIFLIITFCGFLGPLAGNIFIPALPFLKVVFNVNTTTMNATISVFMAMFSVGPLFWGIYADSYGRKRLYIVSMVIALISNILLAAVPTSIAALFVLRVFQAFGTSGVIPLGLGTVRDLVQMAHRGKAVSYFMMGPNMGPVVAPIIAGLILENGDQHWRWLFGTLAIMTGVGLIAVIFLLPETLRSLVGNADPEWETENDAVNDNSSTSNELPTKSLFGKKLFPKNKKHLSKRIKKKIVGPGPVCESELFMELYPRAPRPHIKTFFLMLKDYRVVLNSFCSAIIFAVYYGFSVTFSYKLKEDYHKNNLQVAAAYTCPGVALLLGTLSSGYFSDYLLNKLKEKSSDGNYIKENRLFLQLFGLLVCSAGSIGYGWSIDKHTPLVVVFVFAALSAFGMTWCSNASITYMIDIRGRQAATAISINNSLRNAAAAVSAAIINKLSDKMGFGWCFTGLGLIVFIAGIGIILLIVKGYKDLKKHHDLEKPEAENAVYTEQVQVEESTTDDHPSPNPDVLNRSNSNENKNIAEIAADDDVD